MLAIPRMDFDWTTIPAGDFLMGSDPAHDDIPFADESPQHTVELRAFRIARVPVTNAQYSAFVDATGHSRPGHWVGGRIPAGKEYHPVTYVDWHDVQAFCRWARVRLPSEAEWEKSARGTDGRIWPWGNRPPNQRRCNSSGLLGDTSPVGQYSLGASFYGVLDMAGNVWEWTSSRYQEYPYRPEDGRENLQLPGPRVVRGGTYLHLPRQVRCPDRQNLYSGARDVYVGFRVAALEPLPVPGATAHEEPASSRIDFDWVIIPEGEFRMGNDPQKYAGPAYENEIPQHTVFLPEFHMARVPVTNAQYGVFVHATAHQPPANWDGNRMPAGKEDHPVTYIDWNDAQAFCDWAGVRLPTEAEWEKAARGPDGRLWPWGNQQPDQNLSNYGQQLVKDATTAPVFRYPKAASPYGVLDMAGNVWEWTSSLYQEYPYCPEDGRENPSIEGQRVLRGGSFYSDSDRHLRCAARSMSYPDRRRDHIGFRVASRTRAGIQLGRLGQF